MGVLASLSVLGVIVAWTACKERRKVVATIAIMLAVVDLVYGDPAAFRGSPGGRVQAKTAACAHMSEPPPAGNATTPAAAPPVQPVLQPKLQPELQPVLLKSPASELCPQKPCSALMDVRCSVGSSEALRRWVPDDLGALAVNGTVFLSVYRPSRDGPTDGRPPVLSDMWYNMLWFFSKAMPNASMLVGMPACPADGDVSPWFHHVTGEENYKPALKVGGPLPPKTVRCHPLPPPCDCPGGAMHARCKFALILAVLRRGYSVFWVDSDTALRGNPLATPFPEDADLIGCFERSFHINTGVVLFSRLEVL
ncbi:hypothetical protein DIPPA_08642 [Diplonema papillatum]|nr:hypothetical protein DIPPA_08642 [Diplonema papillatum]